MIDLNNLYYVAGYIINSITDICTICNKCVQSIISAVPLQLSFTKLARIKCYKSNSLCFPTEETFKLFVIMENMFCYYRKYFDEFPQINWQSYLHNEFMKNPNIKHILEHILNCHNLHNHIVSRFIGFRLKIMNKKYSSNKKFHDSKSTNNVHNKR